MNVTQLRVLLGQPESAMLEFKEHMYSIDDPLDQKRLRQRGELIKDILSLANGNADVADQTAYLVLGAHDTPDEDGTRKRLSVPANAIPTARRLEDLVNAVCHPSLLPLRCDAIELDGDLLVVVSIFPSPYLHETTRQLDASPTKYTEHVVFIRRGESIAVATAAEREAILRMKQFHFEQSLRVQPRFLGLVIGLGVGMTVPGAIVSLATRDVTLQSSLLMTVSGAILGSIVGLLLGNSVRDVSRMFYYLRKQSKRTRYGIVVAVLVAVFIGSLVFQLLINSYRR